MSKHAMPITILMADDDADDRRLTQEALEEGRLINEVKFVDDGEQLMDYLRRQGRFAPPAEAPRPGLILLDRPQGDQERPGFAPDPGGGVDHVQSRRGRLQELRSRGEQLHRQAGDF
jgi:hypothetical protein